MNNNDNEVENNETKGTKIKIGFKQIKKYIKIVLIIIIMGAIFYLGTISSTVFKSQTKTTKLKLEDVGELVTQTAYLTEVRDNKENRKLFKIIDVPFSESRQIFSYDMTVDASVDFSQITPKYNYIKKEILVKLPHAKIYNTTLNNDSLKVYLDSESLFSRIDLTENNEALKEMKEQGIEDAKANGIIEAADANAKRLIESLLKSDELYKDFTINYEYIGGE